MWSKILVLETAPCGNVRRAYCERIGPPFPGLAIHRWLTSRYLGVVMENLPHLRLGVVGKAQTCLWPLPREP